MACLQHPNYWRRITAQRLLVERRKEVVQSLKITPIAHSDPYSRIHTLAHFQGVELLQPSSLAPACKPFSLQVRRQAVRLAEPWLAKDAELRKAVLELK